MNLFSRISPAGRQGKSVVGWLLLALPWAGCQTERTEEPLAENAARATPAAAAPLTTSEPPTPTLPPTNLAATPLVATQSQQDPVLPANGLSDDMIMPEVLLSSDHAATCRVGVGDVFPNLELASLQGQPTSLESQLGKRLTIVVFWNANQAMSVEQVRHLQQEFAGPYQSAGVSVITVNVANSAEDARGLLTNVAGDFANLHDPDGRAFAEVATTMLPRTYLLRSDRRVLWFDMEYSRSTSRELHDAILYVLRQFEQQANHGSPSLM